MKLRGALDVGDTVITGSLYISGAATTELTVLGNSIMTGSLIISGAVGDDLIVFGMQRVHGTLVVSSSVGTDLTVIGDTVISGSLIVSSSDNTVTLLNPLYIPIITSSAPTQPGISTVGAGAHIAGLSTPDIPAGTYLVDSWIYGAAGATTGVSFALSSSATVTSADLSYWGIGVNNINISGSRTTTNGSSGSSIVWTGQPNTSEQWAHAAGKFVTSTTGRIFVRAANRAAATMTIRSSSYLSVTRIP